MLNYRVELFLFGTNFSDVWIKIQHAMSSKCRLQMEAIWCSISVLTHCGRVTHICVSKLTIIGSDNGLSPGRRQAIIWTNAGILLIGPLGTNFSEISIDIQIFSFNKIHFKMSSGKWRPSYLGLNVLRCWCTSRSLTSVSLLMNRSSAETWHNNNVIITSKRRCYVALA